MFNKILICTDFSKYSDRAVSLGLDMAKQFKSRVWIVHSLGRTPFIQHWDQEQIDKMVAEKGKDLKATYDKQIKEAGIKHCVLNVVYGGVATEVVKMAYDMRANLIIMGPHSDRIETVEAEREVQLGGVARRVAAIAPCPVMVITRPWAY